MNFVELVCDLHRTLITPSYENFLWCKIRETIPTIPITLEDEEIYRNHIPLDLTAFLKKCVAKLREMKNTADADWDSLNQKYISTFIYYILEQEDATIQNALYASNMFVLLNTISIPQKQFFYMVTYVKVLEILTEFNRSQDITCTAIMFLMDDFKTMLLKITIPEEVITSTVAVLHAYTYCCNDVFEKIEVDISFENLGYIGFVSLKILAEQLSRQKNNDRKLYPIVLSLMSSLKSSTTNNLSRTVKVAHQKNALLFLKDNYQLFRSRTFCLITDALKTICLCSDYDNYDAIAQFIQQLPSELDQDFFKFFVDTMLCNRDDFRRNLLNLVIPILRHPAEYESSSKRLVRAEVFLYNVIILFGDQKEDIRGSALKIVADFSEDSLGRRVLRRLMRNDNYADVNRDSIQDVLYNNIDPNWNKKIFNVSYIQLMCNLFITSKDLVTIKGLNRLRNICIKGSPHDLKPCVIHLKRLLEYYAGEKDVVVYVLSIYVKQMFHPMATSSLFAKELHEVLFSNITVREGDNFVWNIINFLISHNFDVFAVFEKFYSLHLLREDSIRILMEYKIHENNSRTSALKLLCVMLNFVQYDKCHLLEELLENWIIRRIPHLHTRRRRQDNRNGNQANITPTDLSLVIYALMKSMERKRLTDCSESMLRNYQQIQYIVCRAFFEQVLPVASVNYVIPLLSIYSNLIGEDTNWGTAACASFEEQLISKLQEVCNRNLQDHIYLLRDVVYIGELIILQKATLSETSFNLLTKIATASNHTEEFREYLKNNSEVWNMCLVLYIKTCFINTEHSQTCAENLEYILSNKLVDEYSKLQIIYALYDICAMHFQYYDPLIPFLFDLLYDNNAYIRFISCKIIIKLINEEQLRLMDGQYFVFMSLLADDKDIISQNVELFIREWFIKKHLQSIAGRFVPSIVHYNLCYTHPGISLSEMDRDLLQNRKYSSSDRRIIYYCLYHYLPDNVKFNILHHISNEILLRILKKTLPHSPEAFAIFEDALTVILLTVNKDQIPHVTDGTSYYDEEVKYIHNNLIKFDSKSTEKKNATEKNAVLKSLCTNLLRLLFSDINEDPKICQNLLFTVTVLRREFEADIKFILHEDGTLKNLFESLKKFYQKMKHQFQYNVLSINPHDSSILTDRDDVEFYWQDVPDFTFIPPYKIACCESQ